MNIKNIISTIDYFAKDDDNIVFLHDSFDLELNEHFVIETGVVGFTEDGIILEADDETIEFLELNDMLTEGRYRYRESTSEGKPSAFEIMKDIVANQQAQKIEGVMVDMFTASVITQAYDKVSDNNKKKIEDASLERLVGIAHKIMDRQEVVSESMVKTERKIQHEINKYLDKEDYQDYSIEELYSELESVDADKANHAKQIIKKEFNYEIQPSSIDEELKQIKKLANLDENPNPGDFNSAMASPIGSINKNDEERVADANVTGKNPYVVSEKWSGDTEIKSTGKWADKTIAELKKARSALKDKEDRTKEETSKLRQINFAIRSKKDWKGGVAETDMPPESSLDLTSPISGGNMREDVSLDEAEYQGRKVTLNKPMQGDVKKSKVYVKNAEGNVVKVNFGAKGMSIKKNNPERRKSFRARHNCKNPGPKWKARYWSCRAW